MLSHTLELASSNVNKILDSQLVTFPRLPSIVKQILSSWTFSSADKFHKSTLVAFHNLSY